MAPVRLDDVRGDDVPLGWYGSLARRYLRSMAACVIAGLLVGAAVLIHRGRTYTATVEVIASTAPLGITPEPRLTGNPVPPTVDTEAQLVESDAVLRPAARSLGSGYKAADLRQAMEILAPAGTRALVISYRARDGRQASRAVLAIARHYVALQSRLNRAQRRRERLLLERALGILLRRGRGAGDPAVLRKSERPAVRSLATALSGLQTSPAQAAELADAPSVQVSRPNKALPPVTGVLLGLLSAVGLALLAQGRRRRDGLVAKYGYPRPAWKWIPGVGR